MVEINVVKRKVDEEAAETGANLGVEINSAEGNNEMERKLNAKGKKKLRKLRKQKRIQMMNIWAFALVSQMMKMLALMEIY